MRRIVAIVAGLVIACCVITMPGFDRRAYAAHCGGVTVIVDTAAWNGAVERGCAPNPANGLDALHQAGFRTAGTTRWGDAFVCRIDGKPTADTQPCVNTPPTSAYWAYYEAHPGDAKWTYSDLGATTTHPTAGMIEAWAFGAGALPRITPAQANPADPPPPAPISGPRSAPPAAQGTPSKGHAGTPPPGATSASGPATTVTNGTTTSVPRTTTSRSAPAGHGATTTTANAPLIENVSAAALPKSSGGGGGGSPLAVVFAIVLIVAVGVGGTFVARARRRQRAA